jgi:tetratricopeptide (TPR) repeat protein
MKRMILAAIAAAGAGALGLMAQQPMAKSQDELKAVQALFGAYQSGNNDAVIASADALLTKYADTQFKEIALSLEAGAYQAKGDWAKQQIYLEQVLQVNPKSSDAQIKLAEIVIKHTHENDLDKDDRLARSDKLLSDALENLKTWAKPSPQIPDDKWEQEKKAMRAQAEELQGLVALDRKKYDDAAACFKTAIGDDPQPAYQAQLATALQDGGKNDEAIALCDKILADPQAHPAIKQYVQGIKAAATKAKSASGK